MALGREEQQGQPVRIWWWRCQRLCQRQLLCW